VILPRALDTRVLFNISVATVRRSSGHSEDAREKLLSLCVHNLCNFYSWALQGLPEASALGAHLTARYCSIELSALRLRLARPMACDPEQIEKHGERIDPLCYRLLKSFLRGSFEGNLNIPQMQTADAEGIRRVAERVMAVANEGNAVIIGRGAAYYLRDRTDSFHIFVYAPFEERVQVATGGNK
jgi:hypothetical protein